MLKPTIWQLVLSLGVIAGLGTTGAIAQQNPRPSIFDEPPYNRAPRPTPSPVPDPPTQPEAPPITTLPLRDGTVNIQLNNQTFTTVRYEVIGTTELRDLAGRSQVTLRDLRAPVNLVFYRPDRGFLLLDIKPTDTGDLSVTLTETANQDLGKNTVEVRANGDVIAF